MQQLLTALNMTLGEFLGNGAIIILALCLCIEITPIKWNPLTAILVWLGDRMNRNLINKVDEQEKQIKALDKKIDMNEIDHIRWEILNFANSCRNQQQHSKDEFEHVINLHEKYNKILEERHLTNGLITIEYAYIEEIYKHRLEKNDFL